MPRASTSFCEAFKQDVDGRYKAGHDEFELVHREAVKQPVAAGRAQPAFPDVALGDIAFAPAVMGGVNRQAERAVAAGDGATDAILDEGVIAADVKLVDAQRIRRSLCDLLQPRLGHGAQHMRGAEFAGSARHGGGAFGIEDFQRANRRDNLALHAKLDELLRVDDDARSELTQLDEQEPEEIERHRDEEVRKSGA